MEALALEQLRLAGTQDRDRTPGIAADSQQRIRSISSAWLLANCGRASTRLT